MTEEKTLTTNGKRLLELVVTNLGVIEHASMLFGPGMTVITGETGAGKTLIVTALQLLSGQRAESSLVGPFGEEARVEARYLIGDDEMIVARVVPGVVDQGPILMGLWRRLQLFLKPQAR